MSPGTHLELGRVSNLPTVWSNVVAASILAGAGVTGSGTGLVPLLMVIAGFSALYIGGMYLNDACDAAIDARERPERPIPSGRIGRTTVLWASGGWFLAGFALTGMASLASSPEGMAGWLSAMVALLACIVLYDLHHKGNRFGPLLMAACRSLVYLATGVTLTGQLGGAVLLGAALAFSWVAGLTAFAKQEGGGKATRWPWPLALLCLPALVALFSGHAMVPVAIVAALLAVSIAVARQLMRRRRPGDFPGAIALLIAGMSLVDALAVGSAGSPVSFGALMFCIACAGLTIGLQKRIRGT